VLANQLDTTSPAQREVYLRLHEISRVLGADVMVQLTELLSEHAEVE